MMQIDDSATGQLPAQAPPEELACIQPARCNRCLARQQLFEQRIVRVALSISNVQPRNFKLVLHCGRHCDCQSSKSLQPLAACPESHGESPEEALNETSCKWPIAVVADVHHETRLEPAGPLTDRFPEVDCAITLTDSTSFFHSMRMQHCEEPLGVAVVHLDFMNVGTCTRHVVNDGVGKTHMVRPTAVIVTCMNALRIGNIK